MFHGWVNCRAGSAPPTKQSPHRPPKPQLEGGQIVPRTPCVGGTRCEAEIDNNAGGDRIAAVCHKPSTLIDRLRINLTMMFTVTIGQKQCGVNANEQRSPAGRISVASANWLKPKFMQRAAKSGGGCQPHPPATHKPTCNRLKTANFFLAQTTNPTHKKITTLQRGHTRFQLFFEIFCTKMPSPGYPPVGAGFSKCVGARQITSLACQYPGGKFKTFQILTKELHQFFFFLCLRRQKASLPAFS